MSLIPKLIHVTWKHKDFLSNNSVFIQNTVLRLKDLSPSWHLCVNDDDDVELYLEQNLDSRDYDRLKSRPIIEKIDVWRLIKLYNEGGVYVDIDRLCNLSLDAIIDDTTKLVLPTCLDHDFSHDFMMSAEKNPIYSYTLDLNLRRRADGATDIYFLGPRTYMHGVTAVMFGEMIDSAPGPGLFEQMRTALYHNNFTKTYRELPPFHTIIYRPSRNQIDFDYGLEKQRFYNQHNINHWTNVW